MTQIELMSLHLEGELMKCERNNLIESKERIGILPLADTTFPAPFHSVLSCTCVESQHTLKRLFRPFIHT